VPQHNQQLLFYRLYWKASNEKEASEHIADFFVCKFWIILFIAWSHGFSNLGDKFNIKEASGQLYFNKSPGIDIKYLLKTYILRYCGLT
jgi:hypothetical protein